MDPRTINPSLVKRFGSIMIVVNLAVAFFSLTDMYLLASGAIRVDYPDEGAFDTGFDPANMDLVFKSQYRITNNGFYDLDELCIKANLYTQDGKLLIVYRSLDLRVPKFSTRTFPIEARLPIERAVGLDMKEVLFKGTTFVLKVRIEAAYVMGLVHFHLDQVRDYPWEPPLTEYQDMFDDGSLVKMVLGLLHGNYTSLKSQVEAALVGALLANGQEATVSLNKYSELTVKVVGDSLTVKINIVFPIKATVLTYELPLEGSSSHGGQVGGETP